jgi:hypothetical protein
VSAFILHHSRDGASHATFLDSFRLCGDHGGHRAPEGRSGFWWFIYGAFIPIISIPHALLATDLNRQPCPHCGEKVLKTANICPHCDRDLMHSGTVKQFPTLDVLIENAQRDAQAKLAVGDSLSLTAERQEGRPPSVRLDSKHGPVGYVRVPTCSTRSCFSIATLMRYGSCNRRQVS